MPQSRAGTPRRGSLLYKAVAATDYNGWYTLENPVGDTYNDTVRQVALLKAWLSEARRGKSAE